jgi:hypothetical protein
MEEKKKNQCERVLDYLNKGGILTAYSGVQIGVGAVRSRISELIKEGYPICKGWKVTHNQYGTSRVRTYYMEME